MLLNYKLLILECYHFLTIIINTIDVLLRWCVVVLLVRILNKLLKETDQQPWSQYFGNWLCFSESLICHKLSGIWYLGHITYFVYQFLHELPYDLGQNVADIFTKLSKKVFLWNVLELIFCNFLRKNVKI